MKCIHCQKRITGRSDKLYCDAYCKSAYHHEKRKKISSQSFFRKVDLQLRRNHKILKQLNVEGSTNVRKEVLEEKGFDANFFTHYWKNQKGDVYLFCYDYGFLSIKQKGIQKYILVQWQHYMNPK